MDDGGYYGALSVLIRYIIKIKYWNLKSHLATMKIKNIELRYLCIYLFALRVISDLNCTSTINRLKNFFK